MPPTPSEKSSGNPPENRVREDSASFVLPHFDSLPATAGLDNTEAFRLSIRHALALLPAILTRAAEAPPLGDYPDRFAID